jgi:hypothetical protein
LTDTKLSYKKIVIYNSAHFANIHLLYGYISSSISYISSEMCPGILDPLRGHLEHNFLRKKWITPNPVTNRLAMLVTTRSFLQHMCHQNVIKEIALSQFISKRH